MSYISPLCRCLRDVDAAAAEAGISVRVAGQSEGRWFMSWAAALIGGDRTEADGERHFWE